MQLQAGMDAPQFELPDADMEMFSLKTLRNKKNVVLYFYPKDDTPGCTMEANEFTDLEDSFTRLDAMVVGVSRDDCLSHAEFRDKYGLSVLLLSDTEAHVCRTYGVLYDKELDGDSADFDENDLRLLNTVASQASAFGGKTWAGAVDAFRNTTNKASFGSRRRGTIVRPFSTR